MVSLDYIFILIILVNNEFILELHIDFDEMDFLSVNRSMNIDIKILVTSSIKGTARFDSNTFHKHLLKKIDIVGFAYDKNLSKKHPFSWN
ncbi:hypothetical protein [Methanobacterium aggregans]|uniref:hypothetical protein n=1 Tax=Methanobacterium aggregans TaxID=1615586 RepID=UPI00320D7288|nr:hypothetical protein [Methanobacterium aggregans]